tara:strand:- start:1754 stop:1981 length:228 start_codon:yes stop_codon:yes gene_type:complete
MENITKYLKKIDVSLETLLKNRDLIKNAKKQLETINELEEQVRKNKNIKIEATELIDQIISEINKINTENRNKSK